MWDNVYNIFRYGSPLWIIFEITVVSLFLLLLITYLPLLFGKSKLNVRFIQNPGNILSIASICVAFTLMEQIIVLTSIFDSIKQNTVSLQKVQDNFIWSFYHPLIGLVFLSICFLLYRIISKANN